MSNLWAERTPRERKMLLVFLAMAIIVGFMKLTSGGGSGPVAAEGGTPHSAPDATAPQSPSGDPAAAPGDGNDAPARTEAVTHPILTATARDPFVPLVFAVEGGAAAGPPPGQGAPVEKPKIVVSVIDIYEISGTRYADVSIGGQTYTGEAGDDLTKRFGVYFLSKRCGTFLDGSTRFALCVGQTLEF